ncbi:hypothetical protein L7F22_021072 [Adiantum nelumboides]|nr:hypothetical protein [Adiantum nelumboides]
MRVSMLAFAVAVLTISAAGVSADDAESPPSALPPPHHRERLRKMGVTYSSLADNLPPPSQTVQLMQHLGIGSVRLLDSNPDLLTALANTSLRVIISVPNRDIPTLSDSLHAASTWVQTHVLPFFMSGTYISAINVGNELLSDLRNAHAWKQLLPAMQNIHASLAEEGLQQHIKVSTSCAMDLLGTTLPPSAGIFRNDIADLMTPLLAFLSDNSSALFLNVYPYRTWFADQKDILLDYALFNGNVKDGKLTYTSLLDAQLDAFWTAMGKLGFPHLHLEITETGWPTHGEADATPDHAANYIEHLVNKTLSDPPKGTPLHPGAYVSTHIFSLFNEDKRPGPAVEQNWGLLYANGSNVYTVDLNPPLPADPEPAPAALPTPAAAPTPAVAIAPTRAPSDEPPTRKMGINYGREGNNLPLPAQAVDMMLQLNVGSVRIFDSDPGVLTALANTSLRVIVSVKNEDIEELAGSQQAASKWFQTTIEPFYMSGTHIIAVNVGNEIENEDTWEQLVPAMQNIHASITRAGLKEQIMVSTSCAMNLLNETFPPSAGIFRDDIVDFMRPLLAFLSDNSSALFLNVYPYRAWFADQKTISLDYTLFNGNVKDGNLTYTSLLDAQLDAFWSAMGKLGFPHLHLQITETGWPTQGAASATPKNAATYVQHLVRKTLADPPKGTPLHPEAYVPTYIFSIFNEDKRPGPAIEQNWGLLYANGSHVYPVDLDPPLTAALAPTRAPSDEPPTRKMGINYARQGDNLPPPAEAVDMMLQLNVGSVRIFDSDPGVLTALANTSLRVIVSVKNEDIAELAGSQQAASEWIQTTIKPFYMSGTHIIAVNVGNEIENNDTWEQLVPAMQNIHASITQAGLKEQIMVSTSCAMNLLNKTFPPSAGIFRDDIVDFMRPLLAFLSDNSSALFVNVYPYRAWFADQKTVSLDYTLFNGNVKDGNLTYTSLLDAQLDAFWSAMGKLGFPHLHLQITETGWPTQGEVSATPNNAATYMRHLVSKTLADPPKGTPLHPGAYVPTYIFSLFNEDKRPGPAVEQNWGLLYANGSHVYPVDLDHPLPAPTPGVALAPTRAPSDEPPTRKMGINYARQGDNLPPPAEAVDMMLQLNVGSVRIFDSDPGVLTALANTSLRVIVSVKNEDLAELAGSQQAASEWFQTTIEPFYMSGTHIIAVNVGNEIENDDTWEQLVPAMQNIHASITRAGLREQIMVSTSCAMNLLNETFPPSAGIFRDDIVDFMTPLLAFLSDNSSALFLNVYPYRAWFENQKTISLDYTLFNGNVKDGNLTYTSLLDAQLDAFWSAMGKLGFPHLHLQITETGWPTQGEASATPNNAATYMRHLVRKTLAHPPKGTPLHPEAYIPTYIFSLFNEDKRPGPAVEQNWGLLYANGTHVYPVDLDPPLAPPSNEPPTRKMGINYGRQGDNLPPPAEAVERMLQLNVGSVRIFDSDLDVLTALANTSLTVIVSVKNEDIAGLASSQQAASKWFQTSIEPFFISGTHIVAVNVGNEIENKDTLEQLVPAMQNIHASIAQVLTC